MQNKLNTMDKFLFPSYREFINSLNEAMTKKLKENDILNIFKNMDFKSAEKNLKNLKNLAKKIKFHEFETREYKTLYKTKFYYVCVELPGSNTELGDTDNVEFGVTKRGDYDYMEVFTNEDMSFCFLQYGWQIFIPCSVKDVKDLLKLHTETANNLEAYDLVDEYVRDIELDEPYAKFGKNEWEVITFEGKESENDDEEKVTYDSYYDGEDYYPEYDLDKLVYLKKKKYY